MTRDAFETRRKSFEEQYFVKKDAQLVDKLRAVFHRKIDKESIRRATGISDEGVLDNLAALSLSGEVMAAFQLYPLLEVAWADGGVTEHETHTVLAAADQHGIRPGSAAYRMLEEGLQRGPRPDARKAWYAYAEELRKVLSPQELDSFRDDLFDWASRVARASGGILNVAFTVSPNEHKVLAAIERALTHVSA